MDIKKIKIKNSIGLMTVIFSMIIFIIVITLATQWYQSEMDSAGITVDPIYKNFSDSIYLDYNEINDTNTQVSNKIKNITESESGIRATWNSLTGLGTAVSATLGYIKAGTSIAYVTLSALVQIGAVPPIIMGMIIGIIIITIVLVIISIFKGEPNTTQ